MLAALQGSHETVKLLLKHGALLSVTDKQGASVIHYAVWSGDTKCVKLVLNRGGRTVLSQRDMWGRTPLLVAAATVSIRVMITRKSFLIYLHKQAIFGMYSTVYFLCVVHDLYIYMELCCDVFSYLNTTLKITCMHTLLCTSLLGCVRARVQCCSIVDG